MKLKRKASADIGILNLKNLNIMKKRPIFKHPDFGEVRILIRENKEPWFVAVDVCKILDIANVSDAIGRLDEDEKLTSVLPIAGQKRTVNLINESGLYALILRSRKPEAKSFRKWVTSEVLPSIRKHGAYLTPEKTEELITNPDLIIELAQALKAERAKVVEMQPKVEFAEIIANYSDEVFDIGETAKILKLSYGRNTLFQHLRKIGILMKQRENQPYQRYIDRGYFEVSIIEISIGKSITYKPKVYITSKGLKWLEEKLKEYNLL